MLSYLRVSDTGLDSKIEGGDAEEATETYIADN